VVKVRDDGSPVYEYQSKWGESEGNYNQWIVDNFRVGCLMRRDYENPGEGDGQMAIASITNPV